MMKTYILTATAIILSGFLSTVSAFKPAPQEDEEYKSANGKYTLKISAEEGIHRICEGEKVLWTFKYEVWHDDFFVSDDGKHVLRVAWEYVQNENAERDDAIVVYSANGMVLHKNYAEVSKPREYLKDEIGPVGDFWRIWRVGVKREGEKVTIEVTGKPPLVIDLMNPVKVD